MILLNALFYVSFLEKKFDINNLNMEFLNYIDEKQISKVKMMLNIGENLGYFENNNLKIVKLINHEEKIKLINAIAILQNKEIHIDSLIKQFNNLFEEYLKELLKKTLNLKEYMKRYLFYRESITKKLY